MKSGLRPWIIGLALLSPLRAADWKLVWSDEFDRPGAPDATKWAYEKGFVRNRELQFYTDNRRENARVADGKLIIEARHEVLLAKYTQKEFQKCWKGIMVQARNA